MNMMQRILVLLGHPIEDQKDAIIQALSSLATVTAVASGEEILQKVEEEVYDCIVMNYDLGDMDSLKLVQELRKRGVCTPIIILAADGQMFMICTVNVHAVDFIPGDGSKLGETITQVLMKQRETDIEKAEQNRQIDFLKSISETAKMRAKQYESALR